MKNIKVKLGVLLISTGLSLTIPLTLCELGFFDKYIGELIAIALAIVSIVSNHSILDEELEDLLGKLK